MQPYAYAIEAYYRRGLVLDYQHILGVLAEFEELKPTPLRGGNVANYHFVGSSTRQKVVVAELSHTGNGYIYMGYDPALKGKGRWRHFYKISDKCLTTDDLRVLIIQAVDSLK